MQQHVALTPNQKMVWDALSSARTPLSAYALLDRLKDGKLKAPLQVYRALDKLVACGLVHRLESLNAFVACGHAHAHDQTGPTAFAICDDCGQVEEFAEAAIGRGLNRWSKARRFKAEKVTIELRGRCDACQEAAR